MSKTEAILLMSAFILCIVYDSLSFDLNGKTSLIEPENAEMMLNLGLAYQRTEQHQAVIRTL